MYIILIILYDMYSIVIDHKICSDMINFQNVLSTFESNVSRSTEYFNATLPYSRTVQCDDLFVAGLYSGKIFVAKSSKFWTCLFMCFKNSCCRDLS